MERGGLRRRGNVRRGSMPVLTQTVLQGGGSGQRKYLGAPTRSAHPNNKAIIHAFHPTPSAATTADELVELFTQPILSSANRTLAQQKCVLLTQQLKDECKADKCSVYVDQIQSKLADATITDGSACLPILRDRILDKIRPLNLPLFLHTAEQSQNACYDLKGKDATALIGPTGAGKSLAVHFFAGSVLQATEVGGVRHIGAIPGREAEGTQRVVTSSRARSETSSVTVVPIHYHSSTGVETKCNLCDVPGTSESRGAAFAMATGLMTVRAFKSARTLKPVIFLSKASMDVRAVPMKEFLNYLGVMCTDLAAQAPSTFFYLFNGYTSDTLAARRETNAQLRNIVVNFSPGECNTDATAVVLDMFCKTGGRVLYLKSPPPTVVCAVGSLILDADGKTLGVVSRAGSAVENGLVQQRLTGDFSAFVGKMCSSAGIVLSGTGVLLCPEDIASDPTFAAAGNATLVPADPVWTDAALFVPYEFTVDSITSDRSTLLQKIHARSGLSNPAAFFRPYVPHDALDRLQRQLDVTKLDVKVAMQKSQYEVVRGHLTMLRQLLDIFVDGDVDNAEALGGTPAMLKNYCDTIIASCIADLQQRVDTVLSNVLAQWVISSDFDAPTVANYKQLLADLHSADDGLTAFIPAFKTLYEHAIVSTLHAQTALSSLVQDVPINIDNLKLNAETLVKSVRKLQEASSKIGALTPMAQAFAEQHTAAANHLSKGLATIGNAAKAELAKRPPQPETFPLFNETLLCITAFGSLGFNVDAIKADVLDTFNSLLALLLRNAKSALVKSGATKLLSFSEVEMCHTVLRLAKAGRVDILGDAVTKAEASFDELVLDFATRQEQALIAVVPQVAPSRGNRMTATMQAPVALDESILTALNASKPFLQDLQRLRAKLPRVCPEALAEKYFSAVMLVSGLFKRVIDAVYQMLGRCESSTGVAGGSGTGAFLDLFSNYLHVLTESTWLDDHLKVIMPDTDTGTNASLREIESRVRQVLGEMQENFGTCLDDLAVDDLQSPQALSLSLQPLVLVMKLSSMLYSTATGLGAGAGAGAGVGTTTTTTTLESCSTKIADKIRTLIAAAIDAPTTTTTPATATTTMATTGAIRTSAANSISALQVYENAFKFLDSCKQAGEAVLSKDKYKAFVSKIQSNVLAVGTAKSLRLQELFEAITSESTSPPLRSPAEYNAASAELRNTFEVVLGWHRSFPVVCRFLPNILEDTCALLSPQGTWVALLSQYDSDLLLSRQGVDVPRRLTIVEALLPLDMLMPTAWELHARMQGSSTTSAARPSHSFREVLLGLRALTDKVNVQVLKKALAALDARQFQTVKDLYSKCPEDIRSELDTAILRATEHLQRKAKDLAFDLTYGTKSSMSSTLPTATTTTTAATTNMLDNSNAVSVIRVRLNGILECEAALVSIGVLSDMMSPETIQGTKVALNELAQAKIGMINNFAISANRSIAQFNFVDAERQFALQKSIAQMLKMLIVHDAAKDSTAALVTLLETQIADGRALVVTELDRINKAVEKAVATPPGPRNFQLPNMIEGIRLTTDDSNRMVFTSVDEMQPYADTLELVESQIYNKIGAHMTSLKGSNAQQRADVMAQIDQLLSCLPVILRESMEGRFNTAKAKQDAEQEENRRVVLSKLTDATPLSEVVQTFADMVQCNDDAATTMIRKFLCTRAEAKSREIQRLLDGTGDGDLEAACTLVFALYEDAQLVKGVVGLFEEYHRTHARTIVDRFLTAINEVKGCGQYTPVDTLIAPLNVLHLLGKLQLAQPQAFAPTVKAGNGGDDISSNGVRKVSDSVTAANRAAVAVLEGINDRFETVLRAALPVIADVQAVWAAIVKTGSVIEPLRKSLLANNSSNNNTTVVGLTVLDAFQKLNARIDTEIKTKMSSSSGGGANGFLATKCSSLVSTKERVDFAREIRAATAFVMVFVEAKLTVTATQSASVPANVSEHLARMLQSAEAALIQQIGEIGTRVVLDKALETTACTKANAAIDFLLALGGELPDVSTVGQKASAEHKRLCAVFADVLGQIVDGAYKQGADSLVAALVTLRRAQDYLICFSSDLANTRNRLIDLFQQQPDLGNRLQTFIDCLSVEPTGLGGQILMEQPQLALEVLKMRNERTLANGINFVLGSTDLRFHNTADTQHEEPDAVARKEFLKRQHKLFDDEYWALVERYDKKPEATSTSEPSLTPLVGYIQELARSIRNSTNVKENLLKLLAALFAYWTLINSGIFVGRLKNNAFAAAIISLSAKKASSSTDRSAQDMRRNYYLQPHPAQVICLMRLFNLDTANAFGRNMLESEKDKNNAVLAGHFVQVSTGEGKSVVMAVLASTFALMGYTVDCACYSEYLSQRDFEDFRSVFETIGVVDRIQYGTFQYLCENLVNKGGSLRDEVQSMISSGHSGKGGQSQSPSSAASSNRILLVDEVDVFLSRFLGEPYVMQAQLKSDTISTLLERVWTLRAPELSTSTVKQTTEYKECVEHYRGWEFLFEKAVVDMVEQVKSFDFPPYTVKDDKIGYVREDSVSFTHLEGYKTAFAYFYECEQRTITEESRDNFLSVFVPSGLFSYAEIPKKYSLIMGVTGTLKELSPVQVDMIREDYRVSKFTYIPSVYGLHNRKHDNKNTADFRTVTSDNHFAELVREMDLRITQVATAGVRRPVIVVFRSEVELRAFMEHPDFKRKFGMEPLNLLLETCSTSEKAAIVSRAPTCGNITLITRSFGRGTNFICHDKKCQANGGVHVLQTFFADDLAEEVQIMGRTARQGNVGSYSMVLAIEPLLEQLHMPPAATAVYDGLQKERVKLFEAAYADRKEMVKLLKREHEKTEKFVSDLLANHLEACRTVLREWTNPNDGASGAGAGRTGGGGGGAGGCSRTLVLLDGTSSMGALFQASKTAIHTMFERTSEVLRQAQVTMRFEMQIGVYRNYSSGAMKLFLCSAWTSDAKVLFEFLSKISVDGGQGNEAIEIGLAHANSEQANGAQISQVLVLGDAIPNTVKEVEIKRRGAGVDWAKTPYKTPTDSNRELQLIAAAGIPVFGFYTLPRYVLPLTAENVRRGFEELAQLGGPGGRAAPLDVNGPEGAAKLTDQVACQVLADVERLGGSGDGGDGGDGAGGGSLTSLYDKLFKGGNVANK